MKLARSAARRLRKRSISMLLSRWPRREVEFGHAQPSLSRVHPCHW